MYNTILKIDIQTLFIYNKNKNLMVEALLSGIVLGMITVTAIGLFVAAFLQYRRGSQFDV